MDFDLKGKTVGITGAARGIGKAVAIGYAKAGCNLIICDIDRQTLTATAAELEALGVKVYADTADVSSAESLNSFIPKAAAYFDGTIDIWYNHAGIGGGGCPLEESSEADWDRTFSVNTKSVFLGTNAVIPFMKKRGGVILNACSFTALIPTAGVGIYAASKAAIVSLCKTYAAELAPYNIRVVGYIPGYIATELVKGNSTYANAEKMTRPIAMQRPGTAEDLVAPLMFLSSEGAAYITGCCLEIAGGKLCVQNADFMWERLHEKAQRTILQ